MMDCFKIKNDESREGGGGKTKVAATGKNAPILATTGGAWAALGMDSSDDDSDSDSDSDGDVEVDVAEEEEDEEEEQDQEQGQEQEQAQGLTAEEQGLQPRRSRRLVDQPDLLASVGPGVSLGRSSDPKIQVLMDLGADEAQSRSALEQAYGDVEAAGEIFFASGEDRMTAALEDLGWTE